MKIATLPAEIPLPAVCGFLNILSWINGHQMIATGPLTAQENTRKLGNFNYLFMPWNNPFDYRGRCEETRKWGI